MEFSIGNFLNKLASEPGSLVSLRAKISAEIKQYAGMRLVLENNSENKDFASGILKSIDTYLEDLALVDRKFRYTYLVLIKSTPQENPEINCKILEILKRLNSK